MNIRQTIIWKLEEHGAVVSSNELEAHIFEYKKKYGGVFRGIDLMFDMLDDNEEFLIFLNYINNRGDVTLNNGITNNISIE